jgi:predicted transcriptional regulator
MKSRKKPAEKVLVLSIKPEHSKLIFQGKKKIELRKNTPRKLAQHALVYETSPSQQIRGILEISHVEEASIPQIIGKKNLTGVSEDFIKKYFRGKKTGVMLHIKNARELKKTVSRERLDSLGFKPPQSFAYLSRQD